MAKTLNNFVYSVVEAISGFAYNDDYPIPLPWIEDILISQNNSLIRKARTERRIDEHLYMVDEGLEIKEFDKSFIMDGVNISNETGICYAEIQPLLTGLRGKEIDFVSNANYSSIFVRSTLRKLLRGYKGAYKFNKPRYAIYDNKIMLRADEVKGTKFIVLNGIFSDPRELSSWNSEDAFKTPSERNLETITIQHIDYALQHNPDLFSDLQRIVQSRQDEKD